MQQCLNEPAAMAVVGPDLFVATSSSLTEVDASTGALVRVMPGSKHGSYEFGDITTMAVSGPDLFVVNLRGIRGSVIKLDAASGTILSVLSGPKYNFYLPDAVALSGRDLLVANYGLPIGYQGSSLTVLDTATGALVRVMSGPKYKFDGPDALATSGPDVFVANSAVHGTTLGPGPSVTEAATTTGALVRVLAGPAYHFEYPSALAVSGPDLFVANRSMYGPYGWPAGTSSLKGSVTQLNVSTGALVRVIHGPRTTSSILRRWP
jgi:hypothetical protein